jgi:hypothetical protein
METEDLKSMALVTSESSSKDGSSTDEQAPQHGKSEIDT